MDITSLPRNFDNQDEEPDSYLLIDGEGQSKHSNVDVSEAAAVFNIDIDPDTSQKSDIANNGAAENEDCQTSTADVSEAAVEFSIEVDPDTSQNPEIINDGSAENNDCQISMADVSEAADDFSIEVDPDPSLNPEIINNGGAAENNDCQTSTTISYDVPVYDSQFTGFLNVKEYSIETGKHIPNDAMPKKKCFNCLGDHNINECELKKNFKDIARNRQNILGRKTSNVRYHEEAQNKFGNFVPGQISESLRFALGLTDRDAPEFIYRMRVLGYPPGWLKEAEVRRSDVCLFDGNGKELSHPEDEEGEADANTIKYQPEKLITFPGFNASFPRNITDDHRYYRCPRMQSHHRKEEFERLMILNRVQKYKRKKLKVSDTPQSTPSDTLPAKIVTSSEMEIDNSELAVNSDIEFNPPLPSVEMPPLPAGESPKSPSSNDIKEKEDGEFSENSSDAIQESSNIDSAIENGANKSTLTTPNQILSPSLNVAANGNSIDESSMATLETTPVTPQMEKKFKRHHRSLSKGFDFGVAIPESITPYKSLPSSEKWKADVSDHLLFENLPNALGTWGKMKGLVQTVRKFVIAFNAEDDEES